MPRESAHDKGRRLLVEGRVKVRRVDHVIHAEIRGDSGETYDAGYDPRVKRWRCTCQEMKGRCSHLVALQLVTEVPSTR